LNYPADPNSPTLAGLGGWDNNVIIVELIAPWRPRRSHLRRNEIGRVQRYPRVELSAFDPGRGDFAGH